MTSYQSVSRFAGRFAAWRAWPSWARVAVLSSVVGVIAGILAALIFGGVHWVENKLLQQPLGIPEGLAGHFVLSPWGMGLILLIPGLGAWATGLIIKYACPEVAGGGTGEILRSYHHREAMMRGRVVPWKWLASCLTVGTGGAGGTEGPVAQMGSAAGSWLAQVLDGAQRSAACFSRLASPEASGPCSARPWAAPCSPARCTIPAPNWKMKAWCPL